MSGPILVADVGGTTTRTAVALGAAADPETVSSFDTPSPRRDPALSPARAAEATLDRLAAEFTRLRRAHLQARTCAVALGAVVGTDGVVRNASVLWLAPLTGLDVRAEIARRLPWADVLVLNDVSAAAWHFRAHRRFALVTVSTGVAVKVFDADCGTGGAGGVGGLLLDADGVGGEGGHTPAEPWRLDRLPGGPGAARRLGPAAAGGDPDARALLDGLDVPWCECGALADLCSFVSGPATVRAAARAARSDPTGFRASALFPLASGDPDRQDSRILAQAAREHDPFAAAVLAASVRPLAARVLSLCADLGLRKVVVVGGFAHGIGEPWFAALRAAVADLSADAGWFTGWGEGDFADLLIVPDDDAHCVLSGIAAYASAAHQVVREAVKPVGRPHLEIRRAVRPRIGREQFALEVLFAGICGTDLQILRGERGCEPRVPGHECVARVAEVGADLGDMLRVGDLVTLNPNRPTEEHAKLGHDAGGVFRDVFVGDLGHLAAGQVVALPAPGDSSWVLIDALAGVVRAQRALGGIAGSTLLIIGAGVTALLHAMLAHTLGADRVLIANRSRRRVDEAVRLGIVEERDVVPWGAGAAESVHRLTGGQGADRAVVALAGAAGSQALRWLWPALAPGAAVHLFGGFPADSTVELAGGLRVEAGALRSAAGRRDAVSPAGRPVTLCGTRGGRPQDFAEARDLATAAAAPRVDLARLISHLISLDALPEVAAELAAHGTVDAAPARRVVIDLRLRGRAVTALAGPPPTAQPQPQPEPSP